MSEGGFCTRCGAPRSVAAKFCTACGAPADGAPRTTASARPRFALTPTATAVLALLVGAGGVSAYFALRTPPEFQRAVTGNPGADGTAAAAAGEGLPSGHPSIDLPEEVKTFLEGLTADAEKDPQNVEAWQKLARARYRASVINAAYQRSASQAVDHLLALDPENDEGLRLAANLAYDSGDFAAAEKRFAVVLEKHPDDVSALTDLGSTYLFLDRVDDAIAQYDAVIAKDPDFLQAHFNRAIAQQRKGNAGEAIASLRKARSLASRPEEQEHIDRTLAEIERGTAQAGAAAPAPPSAMPPAAPPSPPPAPPSAMPPAAPPSVARVGAPATNASSEFHEGAEAALLAHPIVGPRVTGFEWSGPTTGKVKLREFPMDQMPPFARTKFLGGMNEKLAALMTSNGVTSPLRLELVDDASGRVMDAIDGSLPPSPGAPAMPGPGGNAAPERPGDATP